MFYPLNYGAATGYSIATKNQSVNVLNYLILGTIIAGFIALFVYLSKKLNQPKNDPLVQQIDQHYQKIQDRLDKTNQYIGSLQDIGKKVDSINSLFFSQKLRGNFGERVLQDMLEMNFPKAHFELQHRFKDNQIVDAVLKTKDGLICVDSKFPAENYRKMLAPDMTADERNFERNEFSKAVRKHVTDIEKKYILPGEGTAEFAIMYVPSEAIYYEIISSPDNLDTFASGKKVMMTSPNTMSYFLHIMRLGQERTRIEENAQKVWALLSGLQQDFLKFGEALRVAWSHATNAKKTLDAVGNDFSQLSNKIEQIKELK